MASEIGPGRWPAAVGWPSLMRPGKMLSQLDEEPEKSGEEVEGRRRGGTGLVRHG
jgi:hypothetical protein